MKDSMTKNVRNFAILMGIITLIILGTNPSEITTIVALIVYAGFMLFTAVIYSFPDLKNYLLGLGKTNIGKALGFGILGGLVFIIATKFIPGLSIGVPLLPDSIGSQLRFIIIVFFAPPIEEMFFRGTMQGFFLSWTNNKQLAVILQAVIFAFAHLGAYIKGFYDYSTLTQGLSVVNANISVFISAGLFAYLMGLLVMNKGIKNLWFSIIAHTIINFSAFSTAYSIFG